MQTLRKTLNGGGRSPRVIVARRVIRKMAAGASLYPDEETAEALIGLVIPRDDGGEPDLYLLDTIAPDPEAIDRAGHMVAQGDDLQDEIMYWLAVNWRHFRDRRQRFRDVPLRYLGDWHKQPGEMFWPSEGDLMTARDILHDEENNMPQILAPIVTIAPEWDEANGPPGDEFDLYARQEDSPPVRINFWYLSREMRRFVAAKPEVQPDEALPALPPLAWHLTDRARFRDEYQRLAAEGLAVSVTEWDADDSPPLEVCFMVGRIGGAHVYILVTDKNYPTVPPLVRVAPMIRLREGEDMFERLWAESRPLPPEAMPDRIWSPEQTLAELVQAVEEKVLRSEF